MEKKSNRQFLLSAAAWQEALLQSYRSLHVTIQSILLAVGVGLTIAALTISEFPSTSIPTLICAIIFTCIFVLHSFSTKMFSIVVKARGDDINWWHSEIISVEHEYETESRFFTKFKIHQQARRNDVTYLEKIFLKMEAPLNAEEIEKLIGKGLGHTRKVIDHQLFIWIGRIWFLLLLTTWSGPVLSLFTRYFT